MVRTIQVATAVLAAVVGFVLGYASAFIFAFALELLSRVLGAPIVWALLLFCAGRCRLPLRGAAAGKSNRGETHHA